MQTTHAYIHVHTYKYTFVNAYANTIEASFGRKLQTKDEQQTVPVDNGHKDTPNQHKYD